MRNKIIAAVLSVIGVTAIGYGAYAFAGNSKPSTPKFTESSCVPSPCKQLLPPAWSSSTTVTTAPKQAELTVTTLPPTTAKAVERPTTSTTSSTTSEVPPPLTPEQAAKIPPAWMTPSEIAWCDSTHQSYESCQFPESQGMGEDNNGTDSDQ